MAAKNDQTQGLHFWLQSKRTNLKFGSFWKLTKKNIYKSLITHYSAGNLPEILCCLCNEPVKQVTLSGKSHSNVCELKRVPGAHTLNIPLPFQQL